MPFLNENLSLHLESRHINNIKEPTEQHLTTLRKKISLSNNLLLVKETTGLTPFNVNRVFGTGFLCSSMWEHRSICVERLILEFNILNNLFLVKETTGLTPFNIKREVETGFLHFIT